MDSGLGIVLVAKMLLSVPNDIVKQSQGGFICTVMEFGFLAAAATAHLAKVVKSLLILSQILGLCTVAHYRSQFGTVLGRMRIYVWVA